MSSEMRFVTTDDVIAVSGCHRSKYLRWVVEGIIKPTYRGYPGHGGQHRFSLQEALAVCLGLRLSHRPGGAHLNFIREVVDTFRHLPLEKLLWHFSQGRTSFGNYLTGEGLPIMGNREQAERFGWVDLETLFRDLMAVSKQMEAVV